jgi:hypothetical protein
MKPFDYPFDAAGVQYILRYSFKVRRVFERTRKKTVPGILKRLSDPETQTADELVEIFILLLSDAHPDMTEDRVFEIIEKLGGEDAAVELLTNALKEQSPEEGGAKNPM